jgi:hypothetical protein
MPGQTIIVCATLMLFSVFSKDSVQAQTRTTRRNDNAALSDVQPLLNNTAFGEGDSVDLTGTNVSWTDVAALEAKGVDVRSDCP